MFLVTHAALGAIVGEATGNPFLAAIGGFVSHLLIDMIPHGDTHMLKNYKSGRKVRQAKAYVMVDAIAAILFTMLLFNFRDFLHPVNVSMGLAFGILPDALVGFYETGKARWLKGFYRFHFFFHNFIINRKHDVPFRMGFAMQLLILALLQIRVF